MKRIKLDSLNNIVTCGLSDGTICFYEASDYGLQERLMMPKVHGFGVNVMDGAAISRTRFIIVTGGDD